MRHETDWDQSAHDDGGPGRLEYLTPGLHRRAPDLSRGLIAVGWALPTKTIRGGQCPPYTGPSPMPNPFNDWLPEVVTDPVVVRPDDILAESRSNAWSFSLSAEQAAEVTVDDVIQFADQVATARRAWLVGRDSGPMVLYWWHDEQAAQLRFSLISLAHGRLGFGCEVVAADSLESVVGEWLRSSHLHPIPWSEFQPMSADDPEPPEPPVKPLSVWSLVLT